MLREGVFLANLEALFRPRQFRRNEEVDEQSLPVAPIDAVVELGILFDPRTGAAPERLIFGVKRFPDAWR